MSEDERWERLIRPIARGAVPSSAAPRSTMPPMPIPVMPRPASGTVRLPTGRAPAASNFDYGAAYAAPGGRPEGSGRSALGSLGQGALKFLEIIDKPRSAVASLNRELQDLSQGEGFSFSDLRDQYNRNMSFQETLDDAGLGGGWQRRTLGFVGDVLLDPLTYLTLGTAPAIKAAAKRGASAAARTPAQAAADDALRVAVKTGSSKMISNALAKSGAQVGLIDTATAEILDEGFQRLLVSAAERGRGALTPKALVRSGVTPDVIEKLNIPTMVKRFGTQSRNVQVPFSSAYANLAEGFKGELKRSFRLKPGASKLRDKFVPEIAGTRDIVRNIYDKTLPVGQRAAAVLARESTNTSLAVARKWGADTSNRVLAALKPAWYKLDDDAAVVATNNLEAGLSGTAEDAGRQQLQRMLKEQLDAGVEMGDLGPNYVPHQQHPDFVELTKKNAEAAAWAVKNLRTSEGFQRVRALKKDDNFFNDLFGGQPLQYGTISEINERALKGFGTKLFKDDLREIVPSYIKAATEAMQRAQQIKSLEAVGLARPVATKIVNESTKDPKLEARLARAQRRLAKVQQTEQVELRRGGQIRRDTIPLAVGDLRRRLAVSAKQVADLQKEIRVSGRAVTAAQDKVTNLQNQVAPVQAAIASAREAVKVARGQRRTVLRRELVENQKKLVELEGKLAQAQQRLDELTEVQLKLKKGEKAVRSRDFWEQRIAQVTAEAAEIGEDIRDLLLKNTPPGDGPTRADVQFRNANKQWDLLLLKQSDAVDSADAAAAAHALVLADNQYAIDQIQRVMAELDRGVQAGTGNLGPTTVAPKVGTPRLMDLKQQMDTVGEVLRRAAVDNPSEAARMVAVLEASAAKSDLAVATARRDLQTLSKMIDSLNSKLFVDKVVPVVADGMVSIGRDLQIPKWLDEALTLKVVADQAPEINRYMRKFYNLFKGYAILRPGFHPRNAYSAMFNMYLEAGAESLTSAQDFFRFFRMVEKNPEGYMTVATQKFGAEKAARLEQAWTATAGSGSGQIAGELNVSAFRESGLNPFSENFALLRGSRRVGEWVENRVRGAHAYDVLNRGGTMEQAMDVLNKWQFNYTDITSFDQTMKLINPFWVFFSRNLALQSQEWVRSAARLNRSVENVRRNVGYGLDDDESTPEWFKQSGAIRLGGGSLGDRYLFTDLPAAVFPGELGMLTDPSRLEELIGTTGPWISVPYELLSGRQAFSGIPIKDEYQPLPIGLGAIPGITALPFVEQGAEGPMITAKARSAIMSALPGMGQIERLFPGTDAAKERAMYSWIAYLTGIGLRENTPRSQRGEEYRLLLEEQAEQRKRETLGYAP